MEEVLKTPVQSQQALQGVVANLCVRTQGRETQASPHNVLTKMAPEDDVEAYLELFERTALREGRPGADWANILTPFLTGEAQRSCRDLTVSEAADYPTLKAAILAQYGYSLPARAQHFHQWTYNPQQSARAQVMALRRLTRSGLIEGDGPPLLDWAVLDRCIRTLPAEAKRYAI